MFLLGFRLGDHVVYIDLDFSVHHVVERSHHSPLIGCPDILESKRHHFITERLPQGDEGSLSHILWCHFYLIVAGEPIHEGKQSEIGCIIHEDIDVRQRKIVFGTGSI